MAHKRAMQTRPPSFVDLLLRPGATRRREGTDVVRCRYVEDSKERPMTENKNPKQKQPGEKKPGKYHFNPGNMSGKTVEESREQANADRKQSRNEPDDQKR